MTHLYDVHVMYKLRGKDKEKWREMQRIYEISTVDLEARANITTHGLAKLNNPLKTAVFLLSNP